MRNIIIIFATVLFILSMFYATYKKEDTIQNGIVLRLKLAPLDPRSLMQGDYMRLNFEVIEQINKKLLKTSTNFSKVVLYIDKNHEGKFIRFHNKKDLQNKEILLNFTYTRSNKYAYSKLSTTSYFFEEGSGKKYQNAKFGEFRVTKDGQALLVHLLDKSYNIIN